MNMKKQYFKPRSRAFSVDIDSILAGSLDTNVTGGNIDVPTQGIETGGDSTDEDGGMNGARDGGLFDIGW